MSVIVLDEQRRVVRKVPEYVTVKCSLTGCTKTARCEVKEGRVVGVSGVRWLKTPPGWWLYIPKGPFDVEHLHVRCPEHGDKCQGR